MKLLSWNWLKRRVRAKIKCCGYFLRSLDDRHGTSPEALGPADNVVETRAKKLQQACVIIKGKKWEVIFWKYNFNCNLQEHFVHFYEVIINCYPKFCFFYFFPFLNQLIELFRNKENFKEKVGSESNWKASWPRMSSKWYLYFRLRICKKIFEFCGKISKFLPKRYLFIFCIFYFNKESYRTSMSKNIQKMKFLTHTKQKSKRRGAKNII